MPDACQGKFFPYTDFTGFVVPEQQCITTDKPVIVQGCHHGNKLPGCFFQDGGGGYKKQVVHVDDIRPEFRNGKFKGFGRSSIIYCIFQGNQFLKQGMPPIKIVRRKMLGNDSAVL